MCQIQIYNQIIFFWFGLFRKIVKEWSNYENIMNIDIKIWYYVKSRKTTKKKKIRETRKTNKAWFNQITIETSITYCW